MIVIEEHHGMAGAFQDFGCSVIRHTHRAVNTGMTNPISGHIKQDLVSLIWSEFPIPSMHVSQDKYHSHITQLCTWVKLCHSVGPVFVLLGSVGKNLRNTQECYSP